MTDLPSATVASAERGFGARPLTRSASLAVDVALAGGVALVLGLIRLGEPSLWFDEAYTAKASGQSPAWWLNWDQYHFLYDGLIAAWAAVAGTSEWALRAPSVLGATIAAGLIVVLGRRLFDRWVALASGLLFAASPFVVQWSQQARSYTLLVALSLVATLVLMRALDRGTRSSWALYGVVYSAVVVGHAVAGILLAPAHLVLIAQRRQNVRPHGPLAAVIVCAVAVPWAATIAMRATGPGTGMAWLDAPSPSTVVRALGDVSGVAGLGIPLAALGFLLLWRAGKTSLSVWLCVWALAPFALALLITAVTPVFLDRYLIVAAPAFALLAGFAIVGAGRRFGPLLAASAIIISAIALVDWYSTSDDGNWRGEDWRGAVAALRAESESGEVVVVPWWAQLGAAYYGAVPRDVSSRDAIWVLTWSETGHRLPLEERRPLGLGEHELVERRDFGRRVSLQHWVRRG